MENAHAHQQVTAGYDCELFEERAVLRVLLKAFDILLVF